MSYAIELWEAARNGDVASLANVILWKPDGSGVEIVSHPGVPRGQLPQAPAHVERAWIASTHLDDDVLGRFVQGDLVKPALHHVQSMINRQLEGRASPRLLWDANRQRLGLYIVPEGLIGALWLQFARAVERDSQFRQCAECGIWFELARGTARTDKLYCSTPCRTKAYRKRQAEAARLHGEGRSIDDIARTLESDPETVRGWIERKRGSGGSPQSETE
jgi:transposase-like protein